MNRMRNQSLAVAGFLLVSIVVSGVSGCRVQVDKGANGEDKNVRVDTPFGGVHVKTDETTAGDLGLPSYPGAQVVRDKDNDKSADVNLGIGDWELRVKAVNYSTPDSQDKVEEFYKKALAQYGDVIVCDNRAPVGKPTVTAEGLSCNDKDEKGAHVQVDEAKSDSDGLQLKAGSTRHQHIVGFQNPASGQTRFALVAIDLPTGSPGNAGKKD